MSYNLTNVNSHIAISKNPKPSDTYPVSIIINTMIKFLDILQSNKPNNSILASLDVESLFTNVPVKEFLFLTHSEKKNYIYIYNNITRLNKFMNSVMSWWII